jgi:hypothetical protein
MAQIDNLIGMMVQKKVDRALLVNDKPMNLYIGGQPHPGSPISGAPTANRVAGSDTASSAPQFVAGWRLSISLSIGPRPPLKLP